jgi:hypothetical protein
MLVLDTVARIEMRALARLTFAALLASGAIAGCASDPQGGDDRTNGATGAGAGMNAQPGNTAGTTGGPRAGTSGGMQPGGAAGMSSSSAAGTGSTGTSGTGSMGTSGTGGSPGAMVDCSLLPPPANADDMISTFEDGTGNVQQVAGRGGGFYMYNDMTGMQMPPPGMLPPARMESRCGGMFALCMKGTGFTTWGAGMGTDLGMTSTDGMMTKTTYDASMYTGISFWAKANMGSALAVRVSLKDANTAPEGGNCDATMPSGAEACNDDWGKNITLTTSWAPYTVLYSELRQSMWGKTFPSFNAAAVYAVQFQVNKGLDFDICIDDLAFVR